MRLLFEKGFAPTHAFSAFYRYLRNDFAADTLLHFGMHGALEFMPGKQSGPSGKCWPDRLIGDMPNIYLYAANNPSEASLAKRRSNAITVSHLTPPLAQAGLYKGLLELKESLTGWREMSPDDPARDELAALLKDQAEAVDLDGSNPDKLWTMLLETESALITDGLHVVGAPTDAKTRKAHLDVMHHADNAARARADNLLQSNAEMDGLLHALDGRYTRPVAGGDIIRNKSDGGPIAQALALIGATPRFDEFGRLSGADLIPLDTLGRPRIDVIMTSAPTPSPMRQEWTSIWKPPPCVSSPTPRALMART